jgi:hypothetical protein
MPQFFVSYVTSRGRGFAVIEQDEVAAPVDLLVLRDKIHATMPRPSETPVEDVALITITRMPI